MASIPNRRSTREERRARNPRMFGESLEAFQTRRAQLRADAADADADTAESSLAESRRNNNFHQTMASSAALGGSGSGTSNALVMTLMNRSTDKSLSKGRQNSLKGAAAATLIGAEVAKGYSDWANSQLKIMSNNRQAGEIQERSDLITGEILSQGRQVQAKQAGAFVKSGVKLEGSALNVMDETADKALDAALSVRREADFALGNIAMQTAVEEVDSDFAAFNTLLGSAQGAAVAFG